MKPQRRKVRKTSQEAVSFIADIPYFRGAWRYEQTLDSGEPVHVLLRLSDSVLAAFMVVRDPRHGRGTPDRLCPETAMKLMAKS